MPITNPTHLSIVRVVVICLAIYAVGLTVMLLIREDRPADPTPSGTYVETLWPQIDDPPLWARASIRGFQTRDEWNALVLYENTAPLPAGRYEKKPFGTPGFRYIRLRSSDDTNPQNNGRHYFAVLP